MSLGIIIAAALVILAVASIALAVYQKSKKNNSMFIACVVFALVIVLAVATVPLSFRTVDTGEIAVVKYLGEATHTRSAGTYFDFWLFNSYEIYDAKVQNVEITTSAYSSDAQTMDVAMTLQYQIMSDKVIDIAKQYGSLDVLQSRIQSIAVEKSKSILSSYKAMDIISDRSSMSPRVEEAIKEAIADEYHVTIATVVLTNIDFSDAFETAVEDKMIAEQKQLQAEFENKTIIAAAEAEAQAAIQKADGEAQAKLKAAQAEIEIAKANAEAKVIAAEADREAQLAIARAESEALKLKSIEAARALGFTINEKSVTAEDGTSAIEYEIDFEGRSVEEVKVITEYIKYIEYLEKWDGKLPSVMTDGSASIMIPTDPTVKN